MKTLRVTVKFARGLHARPAATLVRLLSAFRARVFVRCGSHVANAGSILSIILLAATLRTRLEFLATGEDEEAAIRAVDAFFQTDDEEVASRVHVEFHRSDSSTNPS